MHYWCAVAVGLVACASVASAKDLGDILVEKGLITREELRQVREEEKRKAEATQQQLQQLKEEQKRKAEATQQELQQVKEEAKQKVDALDKLVSWAKDTKVSGRMYYNLSYIDNGSNGHVQPNSGPGFDIKRFYVGIDHKFSKIFSGNVTTDFTYDSNAGATQAYLKKAYLDANLSPALDIRAGSTDLPWVPFVEDLYGYRYVENVLIDRTKFGTSADWGVHAKGKFADGLLNYAVAVIDGAGYKHPNTGAHTHTMDFEGRVNLDWNHFVLAAGGYTGKLGKDTGDSTTHHTASRFNALGAYVNGPIRAGVDYFYAWNWTAVTTEASDKAYGVGAFGSYHFTPEWGVFGRYDYVRPRKDTNSNLEDNYLNVGLEWSPVKIVDFALVYKRDMVGNGSYSTSNGTIGGLPKTTGSGTYDEVGIWSRFRW